MLQSCAVHFGIMQLNIFYLMRCDVLRKISKKQNRTNFA